MAKAIAKRLQSAAGGTIGSRGGPGIAVKFGPGGPIILPWTVRGDRFRGGTVHGVTGTQSPVVVYALSNATFFLPNLRTHTHQTQANDTCHIN